MCFGICCYLWSRRYFNLKKINIGSNGVLASNILRYACLASAGDFDNRKSRKLLKIIHALAKHGASWDPADNQTINSARRSLLKMDPDYTVEFVWIMSKFQTFSLESLKQILKTPAIRRHVERQETRIEELIGDFSN